MPSFLGAALAILGIAMMFYLLRDEDTPYWLLVGVGTASGLFAGAVARGVRGMLPGAAAGLLLGVTAPIWYIPFWLVFTLPPHPKLDL